MGAVASSDVDFGDDPIAAIGSQPMRYDKRTNMRGTQHQGVVLIETMCLDPQYKQMFETGLDEVTTRTT